LSHPSVYQLAAPHHPKAARSAAAPRTAFADVATQTQLPNPRAGAGPERRAARSSIEAKRAV